MDAMFAELKTKAPWVFDSKVTPGGGASGSQTEGGASRLDNMSPMQLLDQANSAMATGHS